MNVSKKMTVFLPLALFRELAIVCNAEFRTRSEVVRTALHAYFDQRSTGVEPTKNELSHVQEERTAFRRGSSQSLQRFVNEMEKPETLSGVQSILKAAAKRVDSSPK